MSAEKRKMITLCAPWAVILIALAVLCLYETGMLRISTKRKPNLRQVAFEDLVPPSEDIAYSQNLLLVNNEHPLTSDFEPDIVFYRDTDVYMNSAITEDYGRLSDYIRENMGNRLYVSSSYRSFEDQERVYNEEGPEVAAVPGHSEHQTGLALDVYVMYFAGSAFIDSQVGRYVNDNCGEFGFIIRYPEGEEDITGFAYEPWHIRYVGQPHAEIICRYDITFEEYIDSYEIGTWYTYDGYYIARLPEDEILIPTELADSDITYSPDNTGCVFVTVDPK